LLREAVDDPAIKPMLDMLDSCGTTLLDTFNNLLDYARLDNITGSQRRSDNVSTSPESLSPHTAGVVTTDLSQLLQDMAEAVYLAHSTKTAFDSMPRQGGIFAEAFDSGGDGDIEGGNQPVLIAVDIEKRVDWKVDVDVGAMKRVMTNLFSNALKYTNSGSITLSLKLVQQPKADGSPDNQICLLVKDTGRGMSLDYLTYQLFTPFAQENVLSPGTGLGLSIVKKVVERLGGRLNVQSRLGVGTNMQVLIPVDVAVAERISASHSNGIIPLEDATRERGLCHITADAYNAITGTTHAVSDETRERSGFLTRTLSTIAKDYLEDELVVAATSTPLPAAGFYFLDASLLDKTAVAVIPTGIVDLPHLVIICADAGTFRRLSEVEASRNNITLLRQPITPIKLVSVLRTELTRETIQRLTVKSRNPSEETVILSKSVSLESQSAVNDTSAGYTEGESGFRSNTATEQFASAAPSKAVAVAVADADEGQPLRLLIVDDNRINLTVLMSTAKKLGYSFTTASNGLEAVQAYESTYHRRRATHPHEQGNQSVFDVIFMDISMPVMNGFQAGREIRRFEKKVGLKRPSYIIALTGLGDELSKDEARRVGMNLFLMKPVKLHDIRELLEEIRRGWAKHEKDERNGVK
jgi:CheY-like chemotaxis protein